jgi:hypothetical protein
MISTDDPNDESPACLFCDHQIGLDTDAIALRVGAKTRSSKSGRWFFNPERFDDNDDVKWFHFHCLQQTFDFLNAPDDPDEDRNCMFCGGPLAHEVLYYELALGRFLVDGRDTIWTPTIYKARGIKKTVRSYACHDCVFEGLGEGDSAAARYILGMDTAPDEPEIVRSVPKIPIRTRPLIVPKRTAAKGGT